MLVSSIGYFDRNNTANIKSENNKTQNKHVVNKGLTVEETKYLQNNDTFIASLKESVKMIKDLFSDSTKDKNRSLDMIC